MSFLAFILGLGTFVNYYPDFDKWNTFVLRFLHADLMRLLCLYVLYRRLALSSHVLLIIDMCRACYSSALTTMVCLP